MMPHMWAGLTREKDEMVGKDEVERKEEDGEEQEENEVGCAKKDERHVNCWVVVAVVKMSLDCVYGGANLVHCLRHKGEIRSCSWVKKSTHHFESLNIHVEGIVHSGRLH